VTAVVSSDGGWCWFHYPRVICVGEWFYVGFVASGYQDSRRAGEIRVARVPTRFRWLRRTRELRLDGPDSNERIRLWADDHNVPALLERADGSILATWSLHGRENRFYSQAFNPVRMKAIGSRVENVPSETSRVTYSNLVHVKSEGLLINIFRGLDDSWKPSLVFSRDEGNSWESGSILIDVPGEKRHRPYVKIVSGDEGKTHIFFTEGHPRSYPNSVYHMVYEPGRGLTATDGSIISQLTEGIAFPELATLVWGSNGADTAWVIDAQLDSAGHPRVIFQVRYGAHSSKSDDGDSPISYHFATWKEGSWHVELLADAGPSLYKEEEDYTGLGCFHPNDPDLVLISTRIHPVHQTPLSAWTLFSARKEKNEWVWRKFASSRHHNIRPVAVADARENTDVFWLRGRYATYRNYELAVVRRRWKQ
jgi:hypothetical protein